VVTDEYACRSIFNHRKAYLNLKNPKRKSKGFKSTEIEHKYLESRLKLLRARRSLFKTESDVTADEVASLLHSRGTSNHGGFVFSART